MTRSELEAALYKHGWREHPQGTWTAWEGHMMWVTRIHNGYTDYSDPGSTSLEIHDRAYGEYEWSWKARAARKAEAREGRSQ